MIAGHQIFLARAQECLEGAESELANRRYNNVANRAYYACFQAAIYALIRSGLASANRTNWGHDFVHGQFVGELVNRRRLYSSELRGILNQNLVTRQRGDYQDTQVSQADARRAVDRARRFVDAVRAR